jgi:hypothetical protein
MPVSNDSLVSYIPPSSRLPDHTIKKEKVKPAFKNYTVWPLFAEKTFRRIGLNTFTGPNRCGARPFGLAACSLFIRSKSALIKALLKDGWFFKAGRSELERYAKKTDKHPHRSESARFLPARFG